MMRLAHHPRMLLCAGLMGLLGGCAEREAPRELEPVADQTPAQRDVTEVPAPEPAKEGVLRREDWPDETWDEQEDEDTGRTFLYKELVLSGFWSAEGVRGLPRGDRSADHFEFSPRPPASYVGIDLVSTFTENSGINKSLLPDWLPLTALDLHPRFVFDGRDTGSLSDAVLFAPQDFWIQFNPGGIDRLTLRLGQFVIPYGANPIRAPRQSFILPLESTDLGLKWDWGLDVQGPLGEYEWELAATLGMGEGFHNPHYLQDSDRGSYLFTARVGTPTYWDFQYGLSFLYGDLPMIRAQRILSPVSISRWRTSIDTFYRFGTYLMAGAQVSFGEDGQRGDQRFNMGTGGDVAEVLGYRIWLDYVVPDMQDLRLAAQFESVVRDLDTTDSDDTAFILEASYSVSDSISIKLDYRYDINRAMGEADHAIFLTLIYYGL